MSKTNYTQKTLARLRDQGAECDICEQWKIAPNLPMGGFRRDLFGLFDIIALTRGSIVGIQSTSLKQAGPHRKTIMNEPRLKTWMACGGKAELWLWSQPGGKGKPWVCTVERIEAVQTELAVIANEP